MRREIRKIYFEDQISSSQKFVSIDLIGSQSTYISLFLPVPIMPLSLLDSDAITVQRIGLTLGLIWNR